MKKRKLWIVLLIVGCLAIVLAGVGKWIMPTFTVLGEAAIEKMSPDERRFQEKLETITAGMTYAEVVEILGKPDRSAAGLRPTWQYPAGNSMSQVAIYFTNNQPRQIRWMKLGSFTWEKDLLQEPEPGAAAP